MYGSGIKAPRGVVLTQQIVIAALSTGCVLFLAVAVIVFGTPKEFTEVPLLTFMTAVMAGLMVLIRLMVPGLVLSVARRKIRQGTWNLGGNFGGTQQEKAMSEQDEKLIQLSQALMAKLILSTAMLEGAVFLLLVVYIIEKSPICLGLAVLLIVLLALHFPTTASVEGQLQDQMRLLEEEQSS